MTVKQGLGLWAFMALCGLNGCANPENLEGKPCGIERFGDFRCIKLTNAFQEGSRADGGGAGYNAPPPSKTFAYYRCDQQGAWRRTDHCDRYCPMPSPDIRFQSCLQ